MDSKKKIAGDYDEVSAMGNGVAAVKSDNKWSLIDTKGKKVTKDKYDSVVMDSKGIVCRNDRVFAKQNGYYYLFDSKGNKVVKLNLMMHGYLQMMDMPQYVWTANGDLLIRMVNR